MNDPADPLARAQLLPPTDARGRPDQRALELGEWNRATNEKLRLEEKQRTVRKVCVCACMHACMNERGLDARAACTLLDMDQLTKWHRAHLTVCPLDLVP